MVEKMETREKKVLHSIFPKGRKTVFLALCELVCKAEKVWRKREKKLVSLGCIVSFLVMY